MDKRHAYIQLDLEVLARELGFPSDIRIVDAYEDGGSLRMYVEGYESLPILCETSPPLQVLPIVHARRTTFEVVEE